MSKEQINLSDALNEINSIKTDLGTALNNKGMTVTQEFSSYPTAVTNQSTRTLQFPCNQIETYDYVVGSSLISTAIISIDSMNSGEVPFGKLCQFENGVVSQISRDSQRNISAVALSTPDIDYSQQLGTYNENAATIHLAGQNANFNFKIVPVEAGWVQFKITDALTNKNYYINARVRAFDWTYINVYDNLSYIYTSDASMQHVDYQSLEVGTKYLIKGYAKANIDDIGDNINSVKFTTTTPYFPDYDLLNETFMHTIADFDHIEVTGTTGNFTVTKEYFEPTEKEEYFITPTTAGDDNIYVNFLDKYDSIVTGYGIIYGVASEPTFTYDGSDQNNPIICNVTLGENEDQFNGFGLNISVNGATQMLSEFMYWTPNIESNGVLSNDNDFKLTGSGSLNGPGLEPRNGDQWFTGTRTAGTYLKSYTITYTYNNSNGEDPVMQQLDGTSITFWVQYNVTGAIPQQE